MNNKPTLFKRIRNIIVSTIMPRYQEDLWLDISNGDKNAVLKYKGNPLVGGGSESGSDYQSSGSIVKDMIEQGPNFNWAKYAIDIPSLPCFKPEAEWPDIPEDMPSNPEDAPVIESILADGYTTVQFPASAGVMDSYFIFVVKQTGDNPTVSVPSSGEPIFTDCEPVVICENSDELTSLTPVRTPTSGATLSTDDGIRVLLAPVEERFGVEHMMDSMPLVISIMPQGKVYVGYMNGGYSPDPGFH